MSTEESEICSSNGADVSQVERGALVPLALLSENDTCLIGDLRCRPAVRSRLLALGFRSGTDVRLLRKCRGGGPILVKVGNTRIGLARSICETILTSPVPANAPSFGGAGSTNASAQRKALIGAASTDAAQRD